MFLANVKASQAVEEGRISQGRYGNDQIFPKEAMQWEQFMLTTALAWVGLRWYG
jgi:hypothetical protein